MTHQTNAVDNRPLISIIMPTHNAGRYIGKAIQSVLDQTYPHWELLIINDASTDNTTEVVKRYTDPRIQYHPVERIGHPAGVRNRGLLLAKGEFIAFLDSDDLYFPNTLQKLLRPLINQPELIAVYGFAFNIDEQDAPLPQTLHLIPKTEPHHPDEPAYDLPPHYGHRWDQIATSKISNMLSALMLRRSAQTEIGLFNETIYGAEDYEFYVRMFLHNYDGVYCLSDYVYQYRLHSASITKTPEQAQRLVNSCIKIMDWLFHEAPIPAHVHAYKSKAYVACYRYLARERLLHQQPKTARQLALQALSNQNIHFSDFITQCGLLFIRSFLPSEFDNQLVKLRSYLRTKTDTIRSQRSKSEVTVPSCP